MYCGYKEEGDRCPETGCNGKLDWPKVENCSCHISPPCSACTDQLLVCQECDWEDERPEYKYVSAAPGLSMLEYAPKPLDDTKIDYRSKMHTGSSMIKEGVYPEGTTTEEIRKEVNGTFGGRFEYMRDGKFKFIAYTD